MDKGLYLNLKSKVINQANIVLGIILTDEHTISLSYLIPFLVRKG